MKNYFWVDESVLCPGRYYIALNHEKLRILSCRGSCNIICARVIGLSYANYLRFCRDVYDGEIRGKNTGYPIVVFYDKKKAEELAEFLNKQVKHIILELKA